MVGSAEAEEEECLTRLSLLSFPIHSPDHDGCSTPPFHVSASVPFKWEEEPGKPLPCTALIHFTPPISLQLTPPPRMSRADPKTTKTPSPTTVLDGPFQSSGGSSPERGQLGPMVMRSIEKMGEKKVGRRRRLFGSWSWGSKRSGGEKKMGKIEGLGGSRSFAFPSSASAASFDDGRDCCSEYGGENECVGEPVKIGNSIKKSKSFLSLAQVMPWKGSSKLKNDGAST